MSTTTGHNDLQLGISYRQILKMALPISFAFLVPQINFVTNTIFLGHYSTTILAIAGITGVYYLVFAAIGYGLNNGLQALIARRAGENRPEEIGRIFNQGVFVSMGIAGTGILITWLVTPAIFSFFITDEQRLPQAIEFIKIRIWGLPFLYVYQMRNALLVGTNQSKYLVTGALAEAVTNIIADYLLIFGNSGFPEMGLNGAAVASIISEFTGMFVIFLVIRQKGISKRFRLFNTVRLDKQIIVLILTISSPLIFQHAISVASWEFFFLLIDSHGETSLAISNTMRTIFGLFGIVTWAFAATTNAMVSNITGQHKQELVWALLGKILRLTFGFALFITSLLNLFPHIFLNIFGQANDFNQQAIPVVRVVTGAMLLMSVSVVLLNAVIGTGNSRVSLYFEFGAVTLYSIYVYLSLKIFNWSVTFGWMGEWVYWVSLLLPSYLYLRSGRWKGKRI